MLWFAFAKTAQSYRKSNKINIIIIILFDFYFYFYFLQDGSSASTILQTKLKDFSLINQMDPMDPLFLNSLCQLRSPWTL